VTLGAVAPDDALAAPGMMLAVASTVAPCAVAAPDCDKKSVKRDTSYLLCREA
jgi:hypothetical protein